MNHTNRCCCVAKSEIVAPALLLLNLFLFVLFKVLPSLYYRHIVLINLFHGTLHVLFNQERLGSRAGRIPTYYYACYFSEHAHIILLIISYAGFGTYILR